MLLGLCAYLILKLNIFCLALLWSQKCVDGGVNPMYIGSTIQVHYWRARVWGIWVLLLLLTTYTWSEETHSLAFSAAMSAIPGGQNTTMALGVSSGSIEAWCVGEL